jgi:hypothetical protein
MQDCKPLLTDTIMITLVIKQTFKGVMDLRGFAIYNRLLNYLSKKSK